MSERETAGVTGLQMEKYKTLCDILRGFGHVAVAFSSGVDSTFLLAAAAEALGEQVLAVTVHSPLVPKRERREAEAFCRERGIRHAVQELDVFAVPGFAENPPDRCYRCKRRIFEGMIRLAEDMGIGVVAEGSNLDDRSDYRPGMRAVAELSVRSPLMDAGMTKADIRALSSMLGLGTADKPSFACLASRFVHHETITPEKLCMVERAEELLRELGFVQMRVRVHGTLARIEVPAEDIAVLAEPACRERIDVCFRELGFSYVALDLTGYRTGSMNPKIGKDGEFGQTKDAGGIG